jgi:hypothetical protein
MCTSTERDHLCMARELLPDPRSLLLDTYVYPGHPVVLAAQIVHAFGSVEEASRVVWHGVSAAEASAQISGAGGQPTKALTALLAYRDHKNLDVLLHDLHTGWRRTISSSNHPDAFEPGQRKAQILEPALRRAVPVWFSFGIDEEG